MSETNHARQAAERIGKIHCLYCDTPSDGDRWVYTIDTATCEIQAAIDAARAEDKAEIERLKRVVSAIHSADITTMQREIEKLINALEHIRGACDGHAQEVASTALSACDAAKENPPHDHAPH